MGDTDLGTDLNTAVARVDLQAVSCSRRTRRSDADATTYVLQRRLCCGAGVLCREKIAVSVAAAASLPSILTNQLRLYFECTLTFRRPPLLRPSLRRCHQDRPRARQY